LSGGDAAGTASAWRAAPRPVPDKIVADIEAQMLRLGTVSWFCGLTNNREW